MPELPEVAYAVRQLRRLVVGHRVLALRVPHPGLARTLGPAVRRRLVGRQIVSASRRGKSQLLHLDDGATLVVHFRLDGDWVVTRTDDPLPRHTRLAVTMDDGRVLALTDPRALSTVVWHGAADPPRFALGPEADDPDLTGARLRERLQATRSPIKSVLLDQRVLAGLGNIYAAEALWRARIDPRTPARQLSAGRVTRLSSAIRAVLRDGARHAGRYRTGERAVPFAVYDRAGERCRRCRGRIAALPQAGRTTYWCPGCQR